MYAINTCWSQDLRDLRCDQKRSLSLVSNTEMGDFAFLPLLAWFGSLALEGASGPLLELGWCLFVSRSSNGCVRHPFFVIVKAEQLTKLGLSRV